MDNKEHTALLLAARALNYKFFSIVFASEITFENVNGLCNGSVAESLSVFTAIKASNGATYAQRVEALSARLSAIGNYDEEQLGVLRDEYTSLFVGPIAVEVSPYESSYTGDSQLLFQQNTLDVRNAYRQSGFLPLEYPKVADDHIALEFAFVAELAKLACEAYERDEEETYKIALQSSLAFIDDHLGIWLPQFLEKMNTSEHADFYLTLARSALEYVVMDKFFAESIENKSLSYQHVL